MSAVLALARLIRRGRYVILFAWVLVSVAGLVWGLKLLSATNNIYNAPPGAPSAVATAAYTSAFQDKTGQTWITVILVGAGGRAGMCGVCVHCVPIVRILYRVRVVCVGAEVSV